MPEMEDAYQKAMDAYFDHELRVRAAIKTRLRRRRLLRVRILDRPMYRRSAPIHIYVSSWTVRRSHSRDRIRDGTDLRV